LVISAAGDPWYATCRCAGRHAAESTRLSRPYGRGDRRIADKLVEAHGRSGNRFVELVAGVGATQWHDDTPCAEWDVRTLIHHRLYERYWVPSVLDGMTIEQVGDRFDGDLLGVDQSSWPHLQASSVEEAHQAVARPGAVDQTVHLSFGDCRAREYVMQLTADLAIHSWDLARATGQDDTLNAGTVALLLPWAQATVHRWAGLGLFAPGPLACAKAIAPSGVGEWSGWFGARGISRPALRPKPTTSRWPTARTPSSRPAKSLASTCAWSTPPEGS
jgi:uncharacterized protein (TIGR03086 family)